jgi:hypothetical protein
MDTPRIKTATRIIVICLILISLLAAGVAVAQQRSTGTEPGAVQMTRDVDRIVTYDSATSKGLPPDENSPPGTTRSPNAPSLTFRYYQVSGATAARAISMTGRAARM